MITINKTQEISRFYEIVGGNIRKHRNIGQLSLQALGDALGLTKKTVQRYETGEIKVDMDRLSGIAVALNVELAALLEGTETILGTEPREINLVQLPVAGKISISNDHLQYREIKGYEPTPKDWVNEGECFYLQAKDDSMSAAGIAEGDLLLIHRQDKVADGEIAVVLVNGEPVLRRVYNQGDHVILLSDNVKLSPIIREARASYGSELRVVGRVLKSIATY
ncbi:repressor LexA [Paenibacillus forsythiae]|uniref:Repressor LexA n=1 Tax=Paenibacillus forsythiae TaxID=365616 RepID=A0ABU3HE68_9BACL|nr:XRE family transcriptional regulator [Paenibacillus forsythiae]MDT3429116.1 repressor LexA [Paenibacillus forsythiae]